MARGLYDSSRDSREEILGEGGLKVPVAATEIANPRSAGIDGKSAVEICRLMHDADFEAWQALEPALVDVARVVDLVAEAFRSGGRLIYLGAGSSGRLGVIDASECPPTFGVEPSLVQAFIAGGDEALRRSVEGAEDSAEEGARQVESSDADSRDVVCGIAASGTTPYVRGALAAARQRGARTVLVTSNPAWSARDGGAGVEVAIVLAVGPEILAGSSRLKAGTATKMALNMITTGAMIRWGKVYDNLMVDLTPVNRKLRARAARLVSQIAEVEAEHAWTLLEEGDWNVKVAAVMARRGVSAARAEELLGEAQGILRDALGSDEG